MKSVSKEQTEASWSIWELNELLLQRILWWPLLASHSNALPHGQGGLFLMTCITKERHHFPEMICYLMCHKLNAIMSVLPAPWLHNLIAYVLIFPLQTIALSTRARIYRRMEIIIVHFLGLLLKVSYSCWIHIRPETDHDHAGSFLHAFTFIQPDFALC